MFQLSLHKYISKTLRLTTSLHPGLHNPKRFRSGSIIVKNNGQFVLLGKHIPNGRCYFQTQFNLTSDLSNSENHSCQTRITTKIENLLNFLAHCLLLTQDWDLPQLKQQPIAIALQSSYCFLQHSLYV